MFGSHGSYFPQRRTNDAAHHPKIMQTITITNNGNTVTMNGSYTEIANFLLGLSETTVQPTAVPDNEPAELAPFNAFLTVELTPYFGASNASMIVRKLKRCRVIGDFHYFTSVYKLAKDDLQKRQLLKVVSAVYRYKFNGYRNPEKYSLRSEIKYAKACHECGKLAQVLVNRLIAEGLWK